MADYIIVGAGSAGAVLANRLTTDPRINVILIEAGGWDTSPFIHMPAGYLRLMQTLQLDWGYKSTPQKHLNDRVMLLPRGKSIGGCTVVNGMIYVRGDASDYDRWAQLGNKGWSYDDVLPYFRKSETWLGGGNASVHGTDGPLRTSRARISNPIAKAWIDAVQEAGYRFNDDLNSGDQEGVGPCDGTVADGIRSSVARSYIAPIRDRKNLTVITKALASKIILKNGRAVGVEYIRGGMKRQVFADQEVILSGGAFNSPQLLQLSGIGDPSHLEAIGVKTEHALPGVGRNLQDHIGCGLKVRLTQPVSLRKHVGALRSAAAVARYMLTKGGPAAEHGVEVLTFLKTRPELVAPDIQWHLIMVMFEENGRKILNEEGFMPSFNISRPLSRGTVMARSAHPGELPVVDPNFFAEPDDLSVMRDGMKLTREIVAQKAFDHLRGEEIGSSKDARSDAQIDEYIRNYSSSVYHPAGTCKMGSDDSAVVDETLRVRGIEGLRVVDASIMPTLVSGNTNAPTIMIGEKAADMILNAASSMTADERPNLRTAELR